MKAADDRQMVRLSQNASPSIERFVLISKRFPFIVLLGLIGLAQIGSAATFELVPRVGYRFNGSRDLAYPYDHMDITNDGAIGLSLGYLTQDNGEIELSWTRSDTEVIGDRSDGSPAEHLDVRLEQYHINFIHMLDPEPTQRFILIGLGATRFNPTGDRESALRFSFAIGCGMKWLWTDNLGFRVDGQMSPSFTPNGSTFFCQEDGGGGCYTTESNSYFHRTFPFINSFQFTAGLLLRV